VSPSEQDTSIHANTKRLLNESTVYVMRFANIYLQLISVYSSPKLQTACDKTVYLWLAWRMILRLKIVKLFPRALVETLPCCPNRLRCCGLSSHEESSLRCATGKTGLESSVQCGWIHSRDVLWRGGAELCSSLLSTSAASLIIDTLVGSVFFFSSTWANHVGSSVVYCILLFVCIKWK
jgi:hypothetical protein